MLFEVRIIHIYKGVTMPADFTALTAAIADLKTKVEALIAKVNTPPPDDQPAVDAATGAVQAIAAEIPTT